MREKREKWREKERKRERSREKVRKRGPGSNQSAFNSQKEKLNILAEMLKISKNGGPCIIDHRHYKSS